MIALLRGQSLCAVFSAVANIMMLSVSTDDLSVAFYCFSLTILLHLVALFALTGVTKTAFYKHYAAAPAPAQVIIKPQRKRQTQEKKCIKQIGQKCFVKTIPFFKSEFE